MRNRLFHVLPLSLALLAAPPAPADAPVHRAVCVGVNKYDTSYIAAKNWLNGCVADATNMRSNLVERGEWTPENATLLTNGDATKAAIRAAITNAAAAAAPGDVFVYTHSSHGWSVEDEDENYTVDTGLCAYDADYADFELAADLAKFPNGAKVVVFVDACHSAGLFKGKRGSRALSADAASAPFGLAGRVSAAIDAIRAAEPVRRGVKPKGIESAEIGWVTAADYYQYSWDDNSGKGGEFTMAAIQGWRTGICDIDPCGDEDGYANFYELWNYAKDIAVGNGRPGSEDYTEAQCFNTNVLLSVRAGWAGDVPPPGPDDPPRFVPLGGGEFDVGQTAEAHVCVYAPAEAPVTHLYIAAGDPSATLTNRWFSFTPTAAGDFEFTLVAENANGTASNSFTIVVYPAMPDAPTIADVTSDSFELRWTPAGGAEGYEVVVARHNGSRWSWVLRYHDVDDVTNYVVTGLAPNSEYRAKIAAYAEVYGAKRYSWDSDYVYVTTDRMHTAPVWSDIPVRTAQTGRPYRFDLTPFLSGYPAPILTLAAGDAVLDGTTLAFTPTATGTMSFTVVASNEVGMASATFEVPVEALAPKKFAVCVGINEYASIGGLEGCVNDAQFMAANLTARGGWDAADLAVLLDSAATKAAIRGAVSNAAAQAMAGDTFVYMHSSHGGQFNDEYGDILYGEDGKATFLCVYDEDYYDNTTAYNDYEIAADLAAFPSGAKVAVIVDACHSGGLFKGREAARAAASFDLAGRVSARMETDRARRRARGENVARTLSASEIGWAVACEYYQTSYDGGFFHTDEWLTNNAYGDEYWVSHWVDGEDKGEYRYPSSYRQGGVFTASATWGWWDGSADTDPEAGDNDGLCDAYEFWKAGYDFCSTVGEFWWENPDYNYQPQCTNVAVLRSVELGWTAPPDPIPALPANATAEDAAVRLAGSADSALVEHAADPSVYDAYRAWAQTVKATPGGAPAGAAAVRESPRAWLSFALGADALLGRDLTSDDVSIVSFAPAATAGRYELQVGIDGVSIGAGGVTNSILLPNIGEVLDIEGATTLAPAAFTSRGFWIYAPTNGNARLVVAPPANAPAFFLRAVVLP